MKSGKDFDPIETREWIESLDDVIDDHDRQLHHQVIRSTPLFR